jgi:hypothetical protein
MVMREGIAWGLMMMSGTMPSCGTPARRRQTARGGNATDWQKGQAIRIVQGMHMRLLHSLSVKAGWLGRPCLGEGHVLGGVGDADGALLPVAAGKLVAHLRYPDRPHLQRTTHRNWSTPV